MPQIIEAGLRAEGKKFGIIVSRFNDFITEKLVGGALDALTRSGAEDKDIILSIGIEGDKLLLTIRDFGKKFDLSRYKPPNLDRPAESGYGIYLIRELMDEVEYDTSPSQGTILKMVKYRGKG